MFARLISRNKIGDWLEVMFPNPCSRERQILLLLSYIWWPWNSISPVSTFPSNVSCISQSHSSYANRCLARMNGRVINDVTAVVHVYPRLKIVASCIIDLVNVKLQKARTHTADYICHSNVVDAGYVVTSMMSWISKQRRHIVRSIGTISGQSHFNL